MTCLCSNEVGKKRIDIASAIFNGVGTTIKIEEEHMQAATVICASGIAFWMRLIRATTQGEYNWALMRKKPCRCLCKLPWEQRVF